MGALGSGPRFWAWAFACPNPVLTCFHPRPTLCARRAGPCNYPNNAYSNRRWCCGDNSGTQGTHFDMSIW